MKTRIIPAVILLAIIAGCQSKLKDTLPVSPDVPKPHPALYAPGTDIDPKACLGCHNPIPSPHPKGFIVMTSAEFHGTYLADSLYYDMTKCASCHGANLQGGWTNRSCSGSGCHNQADGGPKACYTCHGDAVTKTAYPPGDFHSTHLNGGDNSNVKLACMSCHNVPTDLSTYFSDPRHIDVTTPGVPEVVITDSLALTKTKGTVGTPAFTAATSSCANVYCHGNFTNGNNATVNAKGQNQTKCGSCHGDPVTGNPLPKTTANGGTHFAVETCSVCHTGVVDENKNIIDKSKHMNGKLDVFNGQRTDW